MNDSQDRIQPPSKRRTYSRYAIGCFPTLIVPFVACPFFWCVIVIGTWFYGNPWLLPGNEPSISVATVVVPTSGVTLPPSLGKVTMARDIDSNGCAVMETTTFAPNDPRIYVVFEVDNYSDGMIFTTKWQGNRFFHQVNVPLKGNGSPICAWAYIVPSFFDLNPGDYRVTIYGPGDVVQSIGFTIRVDVNSCNSYQTGIYGVPETNIATPQSTPYVGDAWMEKDLDPAGKSQTQTSVFAPGDTCIYAVFQLYNVPLGTPFTVLWQGDGLDVEHTVAATSHGFGIYVRDYIVPQHLGLKPGNYTVKLFGPGHVSKTLEFRLNLSPEVILAPPGTATPGYSGGALVTLVPVATATAPGTDANNSIATSNP